MCSAIIRIFSFCIFTAFSGPKLLAQNQSLYSLGHFPHRDASDFFESLRVNDRYQSSRGVRNIDQFAVGREGNPLGYRPSGRMPQRMNFGESRMSDQLEIRERVFKDSIGERTVDPQRFSVRSHPDSVRRNASSSLPQFRNRRADPAA